MRFKVRYGQKGLGADSGKFMVCGEPMGCSVMANIIPS